MERDLAYWKELWNKQGQGRTNQQEFWNNRADFFNGKVFSREKIGSDIVDRLKAKGMLRKDMEVLDIGCGPGKHTLPLAREVKKVTALDISENMLKHLTKNMEATGIDNIEAFNLDWKDGDLQQRNWENAFDLVFASMTPGVFNYETLGKMILASKEYCYLSGFVKRKDEIGDGIFGYFQDKYQLTPKKQDKVYYAFNILWQLGYNPEVEYIHRTWEDEFTLEEAYNLYREKLLALRELSPEDLEKIKEILQTLGENGKVVEKTQVTQGILTWKI